MAEALVIKGLSKRFGGLRAVQDVSFTVQENETVALIGPNGAGKTTSFHLITGFHRPDSGSVLAFGKEIVVAELGKALARRDWRAAGEACRRPGLRKCLAPSVLQRWPDRTGTVFVRTDPSRGVRHIPA